jgi:amidase
VDLAEAGAATLADLVRCGDVSAVEVVDAHLRRIEQVDGAINAVVQLDAEQRRGTRAAATS